MKAWLIIGGMLVTHNWCEAFAPPTWSNWALVIVGIGATIAALRTLRTLNRQTADTKKVADAAVLNAQAVINSERAWMVGFKTSQQFAQPPKKDENIAYFCKIFNAGKTPSRILEVCLAFRKTTSFKEIPLQPTYQKGETFLFNRIVVTPGDCITESRII